MAVRTGTQLKSDMAAADTALATSISSPSLANTAAAITAFRTVERNALDSKAIISIPGGQRPSTSIAELAGSFARDLLTGQTKGTMTSELAALGRRVQRRVTSSTWSEYRTRGMNT